MRGGNNHTSWFLVIVFEPMPLVESGREQPVTGPIVLNLHCLQAFAVPLSHPARLDVHAKFPKLPCWQTHT